MSMDADFSGLLGYKVGGRDRYSAKQTLRPTRFLYFAPQAANVSITGDFNNWSPSPMQRQPDGAWVIQIPLHHGHHKYQLVVDGHPMLDPKAQGIARNAKNERVSIVAVS
jgi:1,4-alpha-glucan branching enzyme